MYTTVAVVVALLVAACAVTSVVTWVITRPGDASPPPPSTPVVGAAPAARSGDLSSLAYLSDEEITTAVTAQFLQWKSKYNKRYKSLDAEHKRFKIYLDTERRLLSHPDPNSRVAPNHLSDLTPAELARMRGHVAAPPTNASTARKLMQATTPNVVAACAYPFACYPSAIDWTTTMLGGVSAVTPVENQGQCGSCYAHAVTATIESNYAIHFKVPPVPLSREAIVNCLNNVAVPQYSYLKPWQGCNGGDIFWGTQSTMAILGGLVPDAAYPYLNGDESGLGDAPDAAAAAAANACNPQFGALANAKAYPYGTASWAGSTAQSNTGEDVIMALIQNGPVAVSIDTAYAPNFQSYAGGVYSADCTAPTVAANNDHAVTIVGYGVDSATGLLFWKFKNSWSTSWGEAGFMRIKRFAYFGANNKAGLCGIGLTPVQPTFSVNTLPPAPPSPPPSPPTPPSPPPPSPPQLVPSGYVQTPCSSTATVQYVTLTNCGASLAMLCGGFVKTTRTCSTSVPVFAMSTPLPANYPMFASGISLSYGVNSKWNVNTPPSECTGETFGMSSTSKIVVGSALATLDTTGFTAGTATCWTA